MLRSCLLAGFILQRDAPVLQVRRLYEPVDSDCPLRPLEISDPLAHIDDVLEGGPSLHPGNPLGNWGVMLGLIEPVALGKFLGGTRPTSNMHLASEAGPGVCSSIFSLLDDVMAYNAEYEVPYKPVPTKGSGYYNSNSFTFTLLYGLGLVGAKGQGVFPQPSSWSPGWGLLVPGLH